MGLDGTGCCGIKGVIGEDAGAWVKLSSGLGRSKPKFSSGGVLGDCGLSDNNLSSSRKTIKSEKSKKTMQFLTNLDIYNLKWKNEPYVQNNNEKYTNVNKNL